jgi:hypothetical protein
MKNMDLATFILIRYLFNMQSKLGTGSDLPGCEKGWTVKRIIYIDYSLFVFK